MKVPIRQENLSPCQICFSPSISCFFVSEPDKSIKFPAKLGKRMDKT